ncbi:MAG: tubulin-like doman-containing protein [Pirellulaceae bacterium]
MSTEVSSSVREVDGYRLVERIGAGGYGEVWKAEAPGGLAKAVKIIFGFHDETRASRELKALNRIKFARHPFLLSLERIDVVDSQLVVVTELADCSLKDRFDEYREQGATGIPRPELIRYLMDTAEALDFMCSEHSLQHLDVKPENLLIVGSHAKVADFGLVKSIQDATASMMAGLTPIYASPEVFHDDPSLQSDQYSLAIVFQEMLTGTLPFPGKNLAQLTAQHLNSSPRLGSLSEHDRRVLSKALSKNPKQRYPNCRAMIEALASTAEPNTSGGPSTGEPSPRGGDTDTRTIFCNDTESPQAKSPQHKESEKAATLKMEARDTGPPLHTLKVWDELPQGQLISEVPCASELSAPSVSPHVVVGVGGLGGQVVTEMVLRREELQGTASRSHWCESLLVDTDISDLFKRTQHLVNFERLPLTIVEAPLRRPQAYRHLTSRLARSLSRRWLYNIPHSLRTEGMRPLGRLALIDHFDRIQESLRQAISAAVQSPERLEADGIEFNDLRPRVTLVVSSSGGTGSGMVWDLLATTQHLLMEHDIDPGRVQLLLLHATPRGVEAQDLARCNTLACLRELHHFQAAGGYIGDPVTGLKRIAWGSQVDPGICVVDCDAAEGSEESTTQLGSLADWLYLNIYEGRQALVQRQLTRDLDTQFGTIATLGVHSQALANSLRLDTLAARYARGVVGKWLGQSGNPQNESRRMAHLREAEHEAGQVGNQYQRLLESTATRIIAELPLRLEEILEQMNQIVRDEIQSTPEEYFRASICDFCDKHQSTVSEYSNLELAHRLVDHLDQVIGNSKADLDASRLNAISLHNEIVPMVRGLAKAYEAKLLAAVRLNLNDSRFRLRGIKAIVPQLDLELTRLEEKSRAMGERIDQELTRLRGNLLTPSPRNAKAGGSAPVDSELTCAQIRELCLKYAQLRTHGVVILATCQLFQILRGSLMENNLWIKHSETTFKLMIQGLQGDAETLAFDADDPRLFEQIARLEQRIDQRILERHGGLAQLLRDDRDAIHRLSGILMELAKDLVREELRGGDTIARGGESTTNVDSEALQRSFPPLGYLGGRSSRLKFTPASNLDNAGDVQSDSEGNAYAQFPTTLPKVVCSQLIQAIPLQDAARLLADNRPDYLPIADRLLTRADLSWDEL